MSCQSSTPHGLALKYHVRIQTAILVCTALHLYKAPAHSFIGPSCPPCETNGRAKQSPALELRSGLTIAACCLPEEGILALLTSHYLGQKLLAEGGRSPGPEEEAPQSRAFTYLMQIPRGPHLPSEESGLLEAASPLAFSFACLPIFPEETQNECEPPARPQQQSPSTMPPLTVL